MQRESKGWRGRGSAEINLSVKLSRTDGADCNDFRRFALQTGSATEIHKRMKNLLVLRRAAPQGKKRCLFSDRIVLHGKIRSFLRIKAEKSACFGTGAGKPVQ